MSKNKFSQKRKIDIILICIIIGMLVIGLILDLGLLIGFNLADYLPKIMIVSNKNTSDILSGVFSAQVSVSTLGIALISILGGVLKETVFGVSISQYLMNDKPIIFKHKINITIELILIACSYITFSLELYNLSVAIFFISIIIILIMVWDIFPVFYGVEYMRADVKEYYISVFSNRKLQKRNKIETLINNLKRETQLAIDNSNLAEYENNLNLMIEIIEKIFIYSDENDREKILKFYETNLSDIFNKMFKSEDNDKTIIVLESMDRIYRKCNELNENSDKKIYLNIFDKVSRQISKPIANLVKYNYDEFDKVLQLEYSLYKNLNIKKENGKSSLVNHIHLIGFSRDIYYEILENGFESYNEKIFFEVKLDMYKTLENLINSSYSNCENNEEIILQLYNQMYIYTKILIDNNENMILDKTFFEKLKFYYPYKSDSDTRYIITMIIYMYYLIEFEELASDEFKAKIKHLTEQKINDISGFLENSRNIVWEKDFIEAIRKNISIWELMEKYKVKNSKTDIAVDRFIIFYCIRKSWNINQLEQEIQKLLEEKHVLNKECTSNIESLYKHINVNKYIEFNKLLFNKEIGKKEAKDKIDMLKDTINKLYKQAVLDRSRKNKKTVEEYINIEGKIKQFVLAKTNEKLKKFSGNKNLSNKIINDNIIYTSEISIVLINDYIKDTIPQIIDRYLIEKLISIIEKKLSKLNVNYDDKDILIKLFEENDKFEFSVDTIIGYNDNLYDKDRFNDFKEFEKDKFKIKGDTFNNIIITIDSKKVYIKVIDLDVRIKDIDVEKDLDNTQTTNDCKYIEKFNDVDIKFTKDEYREYIYNSYKKICIDINIEYGMDEGYIGTGVYISL